MILLVSAFWAGLGPALVLVINPIIQYTAFEQLKNSLVTGRTSKLRVAGAATAVAILSDLDLFLLGAISKLSKPAQNCSKSLVQHFLQSLQASRIHTCTFSILPFSTIKLSDYGQRCEKQTTSRGG